MSLRHSMVPELAWRPQKKLATWQPLTLFRTSGHTKAGLPAASRPITTTGLYPAGAPTCWNHSAHRSKS